MEESPVRTPERRSSATAADAAQLFDGAVDAYVRYRPGYPEELFDIVARQLSITARTRVADLGCGPGTVTVPLGLRAGRVLAVDPSPPMLAAAIAATADAGLDNVEFRYGRAEDLACLDPGRIEHAFFGRSFHWTDRPAMLAILDRLLPQHGAVVLIGPGRDDRSGRRHRWPWDEVITDVRRRLIGRRPYEEDADSQPRPDRHPVVLSASPFSVVEHHDVTREVVYDLDHIIGMQLSYSYSTPKVLGDRVEEFKDAIAAAVVEACGPGPYVSRQTNSATIARRPA